MLTRKTYQLLYTIETGHPQDGRVDNAAYRQDRRADKRRYPHDREISTSKCSGYIIS